MKAPAENATPKPKKRKAKEHEEEEHAHPPYPSELSKLLEKPCECRDTTHLEWDTTHREWDTTHLEWVTTHREWVIYFAEVVLEVPVEEAEYLYSLAQGRGDIYAKEVKDWIRKRPSLKTQADVPRPVAPKKTDYQAIKVWYIKSKHYGVQQRSKLFPNEESAVSSLHLMKMLLGGMYEELKLEVCHEEADWIDDSSRAQYDKVAREHSTADSRWMDLPVSPELAFRGGELYLKAKSFEILADWAANVVYNWRESMLPFCKDSSHVSDEALASWGTPSNAGEREVLRRAVQMAEFLGELPPKRVGVSPLTVQKYIDLYTSGTQDYSSSYVSTLSSLMNSYKIKIKPSLVQEEELE